MEDEIEERDECEECGTALIDGQCPKCDMTVDEVLENGDDIEDLDDALDDK